MIEMLNHDIARILTVFSLSPGSRLRRKLLKEKTGLSNIILDKNLNMLVNFKILDKKNLFFVNFENKEAKELLASVSKEYIRFKQLPLKEYFLILRIKEELFKIENIKKTMGHRTLKGAVCKAPCFWDAKRISRFSGTENCRSCERFSCAQKNLKLQKCKFLTVLRNIKFLTLQSNFYNLKVVVYFSDIKNVYLFGSYAKLIFNEKSDIDIAIVSDDIKKDRVNKLIKKIEKKCKKTIEIHYFTEKFYNNKRDALVKDILQHGVKLI